MQRRRAPRVGADRWLVSYADFTTLLLAFFMALYTVSDVNPAKLAAAQNSLRAAFDAPKTAATVGSPESKDAGPQPAAVPPDNAVVRGSGSSDPGDQMAKVRERIEKELAGAITSGQLEIGADDRGLVLSLPESATFPVASAVVARFIDQRTDPRRLSAAGYGEFHPRASNATAGGRASNRRVDVVVIPPSPASADKPRAEPAGD